MVSGRIGGRRGKLAPGKKTVSEREGLVSGRVGKSPEKSVMEGESQYGMEKVGVRWVTLDWPGL